MITCSFYPTRIGILEIHCTEEYITYLKFAPDTTDLSTSQPTELSDRAIAQVKAYLDGKRTDFDLPLKMEGTDFQQKVWQELQKIPYGTTVSYKHIAQSIGQPKAVRAIGMANNKNPLAIVVPCHRVIGSNGKLVGYAGGLDIKKTLLGIEKKGAKVEVLHDFHDMDYVRKWATTRRPTGERVALFEDIATILQQKRPPFTIVELGSGPGFLLDYLLPILPSIDYWGVDFSAQMIALAKESIKENNDHIHFVQADITDPHWRKSIPKQPHAVITTWTLHDLFTAQNIAHVYQQVFDLLPKNGLFLNGDFVKPKGTNKPFEGGRIEIEKHLEIAQKVGFSHLECVKRYETNIDNPTPQQNYVLFQYIK